MGGMQSLGPPLGGTKSKRTLDETAVGQTCNPGWGSEIQTWFAPIVESER